MDEMGNIGNWDEGDRGSIKGTASLGCTWLRLLRTSFVFLLPFFVVIMLTGSLREEFVNFSLCEFHGTNGGVREEGKGKKEEGKSGVI